NADLSRRAIVRRIQGLSFRQYLALQNKLSLPICSLDDILTRPNEIIHSLPSDFLPYVYFKKYLQQGYYPFFKEGEEWYLDRLHAVIRAVIEADMVSLFSINTANIPKLLKLLYVIASSPPFKPNIQRLSERTDISRNTILQYLHYLAEADILSLLSFEGEGLSKLQKPEKIFLENPNLMFALHPNTSSVGAIREAFLFNQLKLSHRVSAAKIGDFLVDEQYHFEVGGKSKGFKQLHGVKNGYVVTDNLDFASNHKLPIWLFGLLY
ncbi:MAG: AAA family ATPase, partial [Bacteroidota bacterium]